MKKNILKFLLGFLAVFFSTMLWFSVSRSVNIPDSSAWLIPIAWASLFFCSLCLLSVLTEDLFFLRLVAALAFGGGFLFGFDWTGIGAFILSFFICQWGILEIKKDLLLNIKVDIHKSLRIGRVFLVFSLVLMITAHYYALIKELETERLIPKVELGERADSLTAAFLSYSNPEFRGVREDDLTVDEFILRNRREAEEDLISQEAILRQGRKSLSESLGKELSGNEKVSEVFSGIINRRIEEYFRPAVDSQTDLPLIPFIIALILFLTVLSLGTFISRILIYVPAVIFFIFSKTGIVRIERVITEVERIRVD